MKKQSILAAVGGILTFGSMSAWGAPVLYTDTAGDQVGSANAARDIQSVTIDNDATNFIITIKLDPTAALSTTSNTFKYGIGITSGPSGGGDTSANGTTHGNPYLEDISINSSFGGMTDWIGLFPLASGSNQTIGFNTYVWNGGTSTWGQTQNVATFTAANTQGDSLTTQGSNTGGSVLTVLVPMADFTNLGLVGGSTFNFDVYSTGNSGSNTAYDSLVDPAKTQGGTFNNTAQFDDNSTTAPNGLASYTVQVPEPASFALLGIGMFGAMCRRRTNG